MSVVTNDRLTTTLVLDRTTQPAYSGVRDSDASIALRRGLAEYLHAQLVAPAFAAGRDVRPRVIVYDWVDWEKLAQWPAIYVGMADDTMYDARAFTTRDVAKIQLADCDKVLRTGAEVVTPLTVEVWANDPRQRQMLVAAVEDALFPVDWMGGFRLALGHYHGAHADFIPKSVRADDNADDAVKRLRLATFSIEARTNLLRVSTPAAAAQVRTHVLVRDPSVPLTTMP